MTNIHANEAKTAICKNYIEVLIESVQQIIRGGRCLAPMLDGQENMGREWSTRLYEAQS